jgi:branched-chain amino acid transport system substrate-binding protein
MRRSSRVLAALVALLPSPVAAADIVIGLAGPMTGGNATIGAQMRAGAVAAVDEINSHGGVLGQRLALTIEDDGCDQRQAVPIANKLVAQSVDFVIGHFCSAVTLPASSIYADAGTLQITLSSGTRITEQGFDGLFRIAGRDDRQGKVMADYVAKHHPGKRLALIADHSVYADGLAGVVRNLLIQSKADLVLDQSVDIGDVDFSGLVAAATAANVEVVVYVGYPSEAGLLMAQAAEAGFHPQYVSTNTMSSRRIWDVAGAAAEGMIFTFLPAAELMPAAKDVVGKLQAKGLPVEGYTLYTYAAVQLYAAAIGRAGSTHTDTVAIQLQKGWIPTVLGDVSFDSTGDNLLPSWRLYRWHGGSYSYFQDDRVGG